ncbi:MAG: mechanosensitive ion channel, partial [Anaerolineales bacterium]|nr:mechanosensitive ion channel [Anaerolineales bacterium]
IWDQRRLIVPITYFIERPFQNWTRKTAELLGTVFIYADYRAPIDELRIELKRIVAETDLWDKRVVKIQVTNATDKTIELRALVSADNSSNAWELRCLVREKLIGFLQKNYPESLPLVRVELEKE